MTETTVGATEFAVEWDDPSYAKLQWNQDRIHAPEPVTPLGGGLMSDFVSHGFEETCAEYSMPVRGLKQIVVNNWLYGAILPLELTPEELEARGQEAQAKIGGVFAQLWETWEGTYLTEIRSLLDELDRTDLIGANTAEIAAHWDRAIEVGRRLFEIHFLVVVPSYVAMSEFDELYRQLLGAKDAHESYRLLQGLNNMTVESGAALWELSRKALQRPDVARVIAEGGGLAAIEAVEGGEAFLDEFRAYVEEYGQRGDKWDIAFPSWIEDPTPVLTGLREYLDKDSHPGAELERAGAERDRLVAEARERLPEEQRGTFDFLHRAACAGIRISEDHGFWIDFRGMHRVRRAALEAGRRLAEAGLIDRRDDVFFLTADEVGESIRALADGSAPDLHALVAERRDAVERAKAITPPPFIGTPQSDTGPENPVARAMGKMFGGPPPESSGAELRGHAGSPGVVRGTARVIASIAEADRLEPGDVLVAVATAPPWTPLFAIASAVVTDAGGVLSHCAVVAREYGIPAVVGCGSATRVIQDGQTVEVDGTNGVVRPV